MLERSELNWVKLTFIYCVFLFCFFFPGGIPQSKQSGMIDLKQKAGFTGLRNQERNDICGWKVRARHPGKGGAPTSEYKLCPNSWLICGETLKFPVKSSSWKTERTEQFQPQHTIRETELEFESGQVNCLVEKTTFFRRRHSASVKQYLLYPFHNNNHEKKRKCDSQLREEAVNRQQLEDD